MDPHFVPHRAVSKQYSFHRIYFGITGLCILVVTLGLFFGHSLLGVFQKSIDENRAWEAQLASYLDLGPVISELNSPGNDVFESRDPDAERAKLEAAQLDFERHLAVIHDNEAKMGGRAELGPTAAESLLHLQTELEGIELGVEEMNVLTNDIIDLIDERNPTLAITIVPSMDRKYREINESMNHLRIEINEIQDSLFNAQAKEADGISRSQTMTAALTALALLAAAAYGRRLKKLLGMAAAEREHHIEQLESTQDALQAAREELEHRVDERTRELAAVNRSLIDETEQRTRTLESVRKANVRLNNQARRLSESNRDLQEFAYVASHDLQEPLRKILAFSDRLDTRFGESLDDTGKDYMARMRNAATRMQTLIEDLLVFSRVQTQGNTHQIADLMEIAKAVVDDFDIAIEKSGTTVTIGELPTIEADPTQMRQLFHNLIGNAMKFRLPDRTPTIQIAAAIDDPGDDPEDRICVIQVSDNGIGFEPEYAEKIFTVFQRLHGRGEFEGSGIGLAVARRVAERHAGTISASGQPNVGATFTIRLPVMQLVQEEENTHEFGTRPDALVS